MRLRLTDGSSRSRLTLGIDVVALALFVVTGMRSHHEGSQAAIFLRNFIPITAAWLVVAPFVGTYRPPSIRSMLLAWAIAVPVGLLVRSALLGDLFETRILTFFAVALAFTLLFLSAGRLLAGVLARRAERRAT
jgi:hypothetical protein